MMKKPAVLFLAAIWLCAHAPGAFASVVARIGPDRIFAEAPLIVTGLVTEKNARLSPGRTAPIVTEVVIKVDLLIKGHAGEIVKLIVPGGVIGDRGLLVHGAPAFEVGDRVLVALEQDERGRNRICGFFQGRFTLVETEGHGVTAVQDPWRGFALSWAECPGSRFVCLEEARIKFSLDEVRRLARERP